MVTMYWVLRPLHNLTNLHRLYWVSKMLVSLSVLSFTSGDNKCMVLNLVNFVPSFAVVTWNSEISHLIDPTVLSWMCSLHGLHLVQSSQLLKVSSTDAWVSLYESLIFVPKIFQFNIGFYILVRPYWHFSISPRTKW